MGLDGFSMGNLGLNADMTSAQMATQVEHLAQKETKFKIKDVEEAVQDQGVKRKEEEEESDNQNQFNDGFKKKDDDNKEEEDNNTRSTLSDKDFGNKDPKEFAVRINPKTELVELFNNKEEKILETISPKDLMELISKLDSASGVLVNRKI